MLCPGWIRDSISRSVRLSRHGEDEILIRSSIYGKIRNDSVYALLAGNASVYVGGSYISKSDVPTVSPSIVILGTVLVPSIVSSVSNSLFVPPD